MVEETKEEEEEDEEDGLEYATDTLLGDSYMTPPSTGGHSLPSPVPSPLSTSGGSNPETNVVLHTKELEAHIEAFLEEADEDLEMNDLPPLENTSLLPVLAPVIPVKATLPPSMLFADRALLRRGYSISDPNA